MAGQSVSAAAATHLDLNLGFAALAFTGVGTVFVGSLSASGHESGGGENDQLLHDDFFLDVGNFIFV